MSDPNILPPPDLAVNWIGLLQQYRSKYPMPLGGEENDEERRKLVFEDKLEGDANNPREPKRWTSRVTLHEPENGLPVPGMVFKLPAVQSPTFGTKKQAQQYAAQQAVYYLRKHLWMPRDQFKWASGQDDKYRHYKAQFESLEGSPSPVTEAAELCQELGFPSPVYNLVNEKKTDGSPNNDLEKWLIGSVNFGDEAALMPEALIESTAKIPPRAMPDQKLAKEYLAYKLVPLLKEEKKKRALEKAKFLGPPCIVNGGTSGNHES